MSATLEHAVNFPVISGNATSRIAAALRRAAPQRHAAKLLARAIGAEPRSVRAWMSGECAPRADDLIALCAECEGLAIEIQQLIMERRACRLSSSRDGVGLASDDTQCGTSAVG
jgi:hypothetical protein